jgi:hypothetical protein
MQCAALLSSSRYAAIGSNSHEVCLWHFCDMVARCCCPNSTWKRTTKDHPCGGGMDVAAGFPLIEKP